MRKVLMLILSVIAALCCCCLFACDCANCNGATPHVHSYEWTTTKNATCTVDGERTGVCSCGDTKTEVIKAAHSYDNGVITKQPSCSEKGEKTFTCTVCGNTYIEYIDKAEHSYDDGVITVHPDCTTNGEKLFTCSECGDTYTEYLDALGHTDGEPVQENYLAESCTSDGGYDLVIYCTVCGAEILRTPVVLPATGHTEVIDQGYLPTCTTDGLTDGKHCAVCGEILLAQEVIPHAGHNFENGVCTVCEQKESSEGLEFVSNNNGTCKLKGIGTCTDTDIIIPEKSPAGDTVTSIMEGAFSENENITSVVMPNTITSIGQHAFSYCSNIEHAVISTGISSIPTYAFYECEKLENVIIPENVTIIGEKAFGYCRAFTIVNIPNNVTSIGADAFRNCSHVTNLTIGSGLKTLPVSAFEYCSRLENITVSENNTKFKDVDGNLYNKSGTTLLQYAIGKTDDTFTVPAGVTIIGEGAFRYCGDLNNCGFIKNVILSDEVITISKNAFWSCKQMTSIVLGKNVKTISDDAFTNCDGLTEITIPNSVKNIGSGALSSRNLMDIYYEGTEAEWNSITKGYRWDGYITRDYQLHFEG